MNEIWRPIAGYPGYQISDQGRVCSIDRTIIRMTKRGPVRPGSRAACSRYLRRTAATSSR